MVLQAFRRADVTVSNLGALSQAAAVHADDSHGKRLDRQR